MPSCGRWLTGLLRGGGPASPLLPGIIILIGLAAYLLLYPRKRVTVIAFRVLAQVPAYVAVGGWFLLQIFTTYTDGFRSGVAHAAHLGGFVVGVLLVKVFALGRDYNRDQPVLTDWAGRRAGGVVGAGRGGLAQLRRLPDQDRPADPGVPARAGGIGSMQTNT